MAGMINGGGAGLQNSISVEQLYKDFLTNNPHADPQTAFMAGVEGAGHPAKTTGCTSCHNPMMGVRQALPPADMAEYYKVERARQIEVGKFRIGDQNHIGASYKDANWQLRHFYEPVMTW